MKKLCVTAGLAFLVLAGQPNRSASQEAPTSQPHTDAEVDVVPPELSEVRPGPVFNINLGVNHVGAPKDRKELAQTLDRHVIRVERKGEYLWMLFSTANSKEWRKVALDGLIFKNNNGEPAWHYREYDVSKSNRGVDKVRVLFLPASCVDAVVNAAENVKLP